MRVFLVLFILLFGVVFDSAAFAQQKTTPKYDIVNCPEIPPEDLLASYDLIFTGKAGHTFLYGDNIQIEQPLRAGYQHNPLHYTAFKVYDVYKGPKVGEDITIRYTAYEPYIKEPGVPKHAEKAFSYKRIYLVLANKTGHEAIYQLDACKMAHYDLNGLTASQMLFETFLPEDARYLKKQLKKKKYAKIFKTGSIVVLFLILFMAIFWEIIRRPPAHLQQKETPPNNKT